jgi:single-stranded DNA-specific DHH superfamily exonuclease
VSDRNQMAILKQLRQEREQTVQLAQEQLKEQQKIRKQIRQSLGQDAKTIPEVSLETSLPGHIVLWHMMAMKKYDLLEETDLDGEYYRYQMKREKS